MALYRAEFVGRGELNTRQISLNSHLKSLKVYKIKLFFFFFFFKKTLEGGLIQRFLWSFSFPFSFHHIILYALSLSHFTRLKWICSISLFLQLTTFMFILFKKSHQELAEEFGVAVVVTNQVVANPDGMYVFINAS